MNVMTLLVAMVAASPNVNGPRDVVAVTQVADRMVEVTDINPVAWKGAKSLKLSGLSKWYETLSGEQKKAYDRIRDAVRRAQCFDSPTSLMLEVTSIVEGKDGGLVVAGYVDARNEPTEAFYTKDEKKRIADIEQAIRDKHVRHQNSMRRLEDGTPYKADLIQRHHDAIIEMGQEIQRLRRQFDPAAEKRKVSRERLLVKFRIEKPQTSSIDRERLDLVNELALVVQVTDFHIRPPMSEFDRPAGLGTLEGDALLVEGVSYRPPVSMLDDDEAGSAPDGDQ